jgi:ankyrin repeat protein
MVMPNLYSTDEDYSAFVKAVLSHELETAKSFLDRGFDINSTNSRGWTALHYAVENMLEKAVQFLLENGADPNQRDESGQTSLHIAVDVDKDYGTHYYATEGKFPATATLTALLLDHGADPNAEADNGKTPLAMANGYDLVVNALRQHGAYEM